MILIEADRKKGLSLMVTEGVVTEIMGAFAGASLITAAALLLGANNFQIGLISGLPAFATIFQLLAAWMLRVLKSRRIVCVVCAVAGRSQLLVMGLMFLVYPAASLNMMIFCLMLYYPLGSISGPAWGSWIVDLLEKKDMGKYFSRRSSIISVIGITISVLLALFFNYIGSSLFIYALMLIVAGAIGNIGAWVLSKIPERKIEHNIPRITHFATPLKNKNFRRLIIFSIAWGFGTGISNPFYAVYMLKGLNIPIYHVIVLGITGQLSNAISTRFFWGKFCDRYSNKSAFMIAAPLLICLMILWCFTNKWGLIPIHILSGIASAGVGISTGNIGWKLMGDDAVSYISVKNVIVAVFSFLAPIVGGYLADIVNNQWAILFAISSCMAFLSLFIMSKISESGEVAIVVLINEHFRKFKKKIS